MGGSELAALQTAVATAKQAMEKAVQDRAAAETLATTKQDQRKAVDDAATAAAAAVAKLPEDKVLAEASNQLAARKQALDAVTLPKTAGVPV